MDRWVLRCLGVHARRAYSGLEWRARDVASERALASRLKNSPRDAVCKFDFLYIIKLKCTLQYIAKLKIKDPSSTLAKAGKGFTQGIEQE
jgi:hypothetical protein